MEHLADSPVLILAGLAVLALVALLGRRLDVKVGKVHAQLLPNGGSSFRDELHKRFDAMDVKVDAVVERVTTLEDADTPPDAAA